MATQLKNLRVTRVDLVDVGASQGSGAGANIVLFKRADAVKTTEGPRVSDSLIMAIAKKLGIKKTDLEELPNRVRAAFAAMYGQGAFGSHAYVTRVHDDYVIACVSESAGSAYYKMPWAESDGTISFDTMSREAVEETWVAKATGFSEALQRRHMGDVTEELSDLIGAFYESVQSALSDDAADKSAAVKSALKEFGTAVGKVVDEWQGGVEKVGRKISASRLKRLKDVNDIIGKLIEEAEYADPDTAVPEDDVNKSAVTKRGNLNGGDTMYDEKVLAGLPAEVRTVVTAEVARLTKAASDALAVAETAKAEAKTAKDELAKATAKEPTEDEVLKSLPVSVRKIVEDAKSSAEEATKVAKAERDARLKTEYVSKAAAFKGLPVDSTKDWELLKAIDEKLSKEQADRLSEILKAADAAMLTAGAFREIGSLGAPVDGTAFEKINKLALDMVSKSPEMTVEKARVRVMELHPELYAEHAAESRGEEA